MNGEADVMFFFSKKRVMPEEKQFRDDLLFLKARMHALIHLHYKSQVSTWSIHTTDSYSRIVIVLITIKNMPAVWSLDLGAERLVSERLVSSGNRDCEGPMKHPHFHRSSRAHFIKRRTTRCDAARH